MRTFAHEQKPTQPRASSSRARNRRTDPILHLQGTIGNQATRSLLRLGIQPGRTVSHPAPGTVQRTPAPPSYGGVTGVRDLARIRIDAVPDFLASSLTAPRDVNVHISDPNVVHITWMFYDPNDQMMSGSFSTLPGHPTSTTSS